MPKWLAICFIGFFGISSSLFAQWEPTQRLTHTPGRSYLSDANTWCIAAWSGGFVHVVWYDSTYPGGAYPFYEIFYRHSINGGVSWEPVQRLTSLDDINSDCPSVAISDTVVHVVWIDRRDGSSETYYKRSTDCGITWSQDKRLSDCPYTSRYASLAVSGTDVHVVWEDNRHFSPSPFWEIYYKRSTDGGITWSPDTCLATHPQSKTTARPSVAVSGTNVHVVWTTNDVEPTGNYEIFYRRSSDGGVTWESKIRLTNDPEISYFPSVAVSDTVVHIAWYDGKNTAYTDIYYRRSIDGGISWEPEKRLTNAAGPSFQPNLAASGFNVHLVWDDYRNGNDTEIYYKHSMDGGVTWSTDTRLSNLPLISSHPSVAIADTVVHVAWFDWQDGNPEIYYRRDPTGNTGVEEKTDTRCQISDARSKVFPNPFVSYTRILGYKQESFTLYDISGRVLGAYKGDRIGVDLSPGVYFLVPENKNTKPIRIVKVR